MTTRTNAPSDEMEAVNFTAIPSPSVATAGDDDDVDSLLKELESPKRSTTPSNNDTNNNGNGEEEDEDDDNKDSSSSSNQNNTDPLSNMKVSSGRLLTSLGLLTLDLDAKLGLRDRARQIDARLQLTAKSQHVVETVSTRVQDLDRRLQIKESTQRALGKIQTTVTPTLHRAGQHVKEFNDKHELTNKTSHWMNSTAELFGGNTKESAVEDSVLGGGAAVVTAAAATNKPDFPSSFQN